MKMKSLLILLMCLLMISTITLGLKMKAEEKKFITTYKKELSIFSFEFPANQDTITNVVTHLSEDVKSAVIRNLKLDNKFTFSWYPLAITVSILSYLSLLRLRRSDHSKFNDSIRTPGLILIFLISAQLIAFVLD